MANHEGTDHPAPVGHVDDGDVPAGATEPDEGTSVREKQLRLLFTAPILLGLFICALNLLVVTRLWRAVYFSDLGLLSRANLPNTVCFSSITISFAIGLALIVYAIALRHYEEWYDLKTDIGQESVQESRSKSGLGRVPSYIKWILGPILVAIPAPAITVWAASTVEPISAKPCIEVYREAAAVKKDNPRFKLAWNDRDQLRCSVNQALED